MPDFAVRLATLDEAADVADVLREAFESYRPQYTVAHGHDCIVLSTTPFLHAALHDGEATLTPASSFSSG